jgi:hypothetical protein
MTDITNKFPKFILRTFSRIELIDPKTMPKVLLKDRTQYFIKNLMQPDDKLYTYDVFKFRYFILLRHMLDGTHGWELDDDIQDDRHLKKRNDVMDDTIKKFDYRYHDIKYIYVYVEEPVVHDIMIKYTCRSYNKVTLGLLLWTHDMTYKYINRYDSENIQRNFDDLTYNGEANIIQKDDTILCNFCCDWG